MRKQLTAYENVQQYDKARVTGTLVFGKYLTTKRPSTGNYNITPHYEVSIGDPQIVGMKRRDGSTPTGLVQYLKDRLFQSHSSVFTDHKAHPAISLADKGKYPPRVYGLVDTPENSRGVSSTSLLVRKDSNGNPIMGVNPDTQQREPKYNSLRSGQKITALVSVFEYGAHRFSYTLQGVVVKDIEHLDIYGTGNSVLSDFGLHRIKPQNMGSHDANANEANSGNTSTSTNVNNPFNHGNSATSQTTANSAGNNNQGNSSDNVEQTSKDNPFV